MRLNPFKKNPVKKQQTKLLKDATAKLSTDIKEIEKIADPAERVKKYADVNQKLECFYSEGEKPSVLNYESDGAQAGSIAGGLFGGVGGLIGGGIAAATLIPAVITTAPVAVPLIAVATVGAAVVGAGTPVGLSGLVGGIKNRKELRAKYGSIRNARRVYKLQEAVAKKTEHDKTAISNAKLRERFNTVYKGATGAEAAPAAKSAPSSRQPKL